MKTPKCPKCNAELAVEHPTVSNAVIVYCSNGKCPSTVANSGASGATLEEALEDLDRLIAIEDSEREREEG